MSMSDRQRKAAFTCLAHNWDELYREFTWSACKVDGETADGMLWGLASSLADPSVSQGELALLMADARTAARNVVAYETGGSVEPITETSEDFHGSEKGQRVAYEAWTDRLVTAVHAMTLGERPPLLRSVS